MPKSKSKSATGDGSGLTTRSNSIDGDADQSNGANGTTDDTSQVNNNTSASLPISQGSSLGYGQPQQPSTLIHTVVNRPVYDGKMSIFLHGKCNWKLIFMKEKCPNCSQKITLIQLIIRTFTSS